MESFISYVLDHILLLHLLHEAGKVIAQMERRSHHMGSRAARRIAIWARVATLLVLLTLVLTLGQVHALPPAKRSAVVSVSGWIA